MVEMVDKFATSPERKAILVGLLRYRDALAAAGIVDGFQWLDGSFLENIEERERRPPADIDIVTFLHRPNAAKNATAWATFVSDNLEIFDVNRVKSAYSCHAFFVDLDLPPEVVVDHARYYFGLFSHRRVTQQWKGMLRVPLYGQDDVTAFMRLTSEDSA